MRLKGMMLCVVFISYKYTHLGRRQPFMHSDITFLWCVLTVTVDVWWKARPRTRTLLAPFVNGNTSYNIHSVMNTPTLTYIYIYDVLCILYMSIYVYSSHCQFIMCEEDVFTWKVLNAPSSVVTSYSRGDSYWFDAAIVGRISIYTAALCTYRTRFRLKFLPSGTKKIYLWNAIPIWVFGIN